MQTHLHASLRYGSTTLGGLEMAGNHVCSFSPNAGWDYGNVRSTCKISGIVSHYFKADRVARHKSFLLKNIQN